MTSAITRHFRIRGRVQGVGFRYATQKQARKLGLSGWVRNCPDNSVEAEATGNPASLVAFEQWLHQGPPGARVTQVEADVSPENEVLETKPCTVEFQILR